MLHLTSIFEVENLRSISYKKHHNRIPLVSRITRNKIDKRYYNRSHSPIIFIQSIFFILLSFTSRLFFSFLQRMTSIAKSPRGFDGVSFFFRASFIQSNLNGYTHSCHFATFFYPSPPFLDHLLSVLLVRSRLKTTRL